MQGWSFSGSILFDHVTRAVISSIKNRRTIATAAIARPTFGLPAIIGLNLSGIFRVGFAHWHVRVLGRNDFDPFS